MLNVVTRYGQWVSAAPLPCTMAALLGLCAVALWLHGRGHDGWLADAGVLGCLYGAAVSLFDGRSRHAEHLRVLGLIDRFGFRRRIFRAMSGSRCQRDAALRAAARQGCLPQARSYYQELGYRWFHVLPDDILVNPLPYLSLRFLRPPRSRTRPPA